MVTITIHRGELLQIKRIITKTKKAKNLKGRLYGLYTESYQPVVLIVCRGDKKEVDEYVWKNHKLLSIGEWIVSDENEAEPRAEKAVTVKLDCDGQIVSAFFKDEPATLDVLEGQSAFREYKSLTDYLKKETELDSSPMKIEQRNETLYSKYERPATQSRSTRDLIIDVESQTSDVSHCSSTSQWYNTARDTFQNTYNFVRRKFADNETVEISRNTSTEDMSFKFIHSRSSWFIEFPAEFPGGVVLLRNVSKGREEKVFSSEAPNLSNMKNRLMEEFTKMCQCDRCRNRETKSWESWV